MSSVAPASGLRERNRVRRTRRVERASLELALEHGVDHVTVDMICEASDISPRTYFNYFGTKEGALLGLGNVPYAESDIEVFLSAGGHIVEDLLHLVAATFVASEPDRDVYLMRRRLFAREPELQGLQLARMAGKRHALTRVVEQRIAAERPDLPPAEVCDEAQLVVAVAAGAFPVAGRVWAEREDAAEHIEVVIADVIARVRRIVAS
ncbi:TetR/AcrR family transcriptional regulator [Demequina iriomotensis]|uniref:TetR/AcrR family transcriptional regulator n=1 Tax=Demequina iriomotensis TaxID=1536641 RepID=UPI000781A140|nr:TetR/AcrR family transcriptional regulator [Demequina iriomotensis]